MIFGGSDPLKSWFEAIEAEGDYTMVRFGRVRPGGAEVEWVKVFHGECDGIGGFGEILRERGAEVERLPANRNLRGASWVPFLRSLPKHLGLRRKLGWKELGRGERDGGEELPDPVIAWHVFDEEETGSLRAAAKRMGVTVNSFLLKSLDEALRGDQVDAGAAVPWMVPVNLRGEVKGGRDSENHSSYLSVKVSPGEDVEELHREIFRKLEAGEHWANWKTYCATRILPGFLKRFLFRHGRAMAEWNLGVLTNLGVWDAEKKMTNEELRGDWMIAGPVLRCQLVGAGLLTFQGRLTMTVQAHPDLTTSMEVVERWMRDWVARSRAMEGMV